MDNPISTTIVVSPSPDQANFNNKLHGGELLKLLDQVASATSRRFSRLYCITAKVMEVQYLEPIDIGCLLSIRGEVVKVGRTSMTIDMIAVTENIETSTQVRCVTAKFLMVGVDANKVPTPVPKIPEYHKDKCKSCGHVKHKINDNWFNPKMNNHYSQYFEETEDRDSGSLKSSNNDN
jgi:acyl-CoA hydrolase